jgi:hypothetical protein
MCKRFLQFEAELLIFGTGFGGKMKNVTISPSVETLRATSLLASIWQGVGKDFASPGKLKVLA